MSVSNLSMNIGSLSGKVALVTGAARGIGQAIAMQLASMGADVAVCDLRSDVAATASNIRALNRRAFSGVLDIGNRRVLEEFFREVTSTLGRLDILVNNAAINIRKPLLDLDAADIERVSSVGFCGVVHCTQLAARQMCAQGQGGNIVSISSVHAFRPFCGSSLYNGAKAAVNHMSRTWAAELAGSGIRVNVVEPGWIDTPGERDFYSEESLLAAAKELPFGRLGLPDDIARAVAFLVSDDAAYITGVSLRVDGGIVLTR